MLKLIRIADRTVATLWWTMISVIIATALATLGTRMVGLEQLTVRSGSMTGTFNTGDLLLVHGERFETLKVGGVYTFVSNLPGHPLITHRVIARNSDGTYKTKGDFNQVQDPWDLQVTQVVAQPKFIIPSGGFAWAWIFDNRLLIGLFVFAVAGLRVLMSKLRFKTKPAKSNPLVPEGMEIIQRIVIDSEGYVLSKA